MLKLFSLFFALFFLPFFTKIQENNIAIKVGTQTWTSKEVQNYFSFHLKNSLLEGQNFNHIKKEILNEIILRSLVENWATRKKIKKSTVSLGKEERERFSQPHSLLKALKEHKTALFLQDLLLKDFLKKTSPPSIKKQKALYQQKQSSFIKPASCHLKQILVKKKSLAQILQKKLTQGEAFHHLSKLHSLQKHPGWIKKGSLTVFDQACFNRKNSINAIVKSPYGYHIFRVAQKSSEKKLSFQQAQNQIIHFLKNKAAKKQFQFWLKKELLNTKVWTNIKLLDKIHIQYKGS